MKLYDLSCVMFKYAENHINYPYSKPITFLALTVNL